MYVKLDKEKRDRWVSSCTGATFRVRARIVFLAGSNGHSIPAAVEGIKAAIVEADLAFSIMESIDALNLAVDETIDRPTRISSTCHVKPAMCLSTTL